MKVAYSREGGLFPQVAQTKLNTTELPPDLQTLAEAVLADPKAYTADSATTGLRDGYHYRLDLRDGRRKVSLTFDDLSLPDHVQPLIDFLQQRTGKP